MQSANLQYLYPDESQKGGKNQGIIAQYPYFAPDQAYLKKAPKMTKADELYLKKFMFARKNKDISRVDQSVIAEKQYTTPKNDEKKPDGNVNVEINVNQRLFLERNKHLKPEQVKYRSGTGDLITLTDKVFGEQRYFQSNDDTANDKQMDDYVKEDWEPPALPDKKKSAQSEMKGRIGNVVPFFPSDWKKNANDVFNLIMNGGVAIEDGIEEKTNAAVYKKLPDTQSS